MVTHSSWRQWSTSHTAQHKGQGTISFPFIDCCYNANSSKVTMTTPQGEHIDRIPAWIKRVTQDLSYSPVYDAIFWNPPKKYIFKNRPPPRPQSVRVYEAHGDILSTKDPMLIISGHLHD